jgi:hypothetical protein
MEFVKSPTGVLHIILSKEEQRMLCHAISGGAQAEIKFSEEPIQEDPLKYFKENTRKAILDMVNKFKTVPFTGYQVTDIKQKHYVPDLHHVFKRLKSRNLITVDSKSHSLKVYQFSEKLCRHFGN